MLNIESMGHKINLICICLKYQGILFEKNLKFNKHLTVTVKRANKLACLMKRTFSFMDKEVFLTRVEFD